LVREVRYMQRSLVLNWSESHKNLQRAVSDKITDPAEMGDTGRGWTYVTFYPPGTQPGHVLFNIDHVRLLAQENDFFLPPEVFVEHNKVVVTAQSEDGRPTSQLFGLYRLIETYAERYGDIDRFPKHGYYGKFGGVYGRPGKGRVLAIYTNDEDTLLDIFESIEGIVGELKTPGIRYAMKLSNGLSALPRLLHGFDDPRHRKSGTTHYRITDPSRFLVLINQAKRDYSEYLFG
jgi:hypothetical protein